MKTIFNNTAGLFGNIYSTLLESGAELIIPIVLLGALFSFMHPNFLTGSNLVNILQSIAIFTMASVAMTLVVMEGGIDLSIGAALALIVTVTASVLLAGYGIALAILTALLLGALIGLINGAFIAVLRVDSLIVTIGMMTALRGIAHIYVGKRAFYNFPDHFVAIAQGRLLGVPNIIWMAAVVVLVGFFIIKYTKIGGNWIAIGGNRNASRLAGIPIRKYEILVYCVSGVIIAIASIVQMARLDAAYASFGRGLELDAITIVALGGTVLGGGKVNFTGTVLAAILIGLINNGLILSGVGFFWQSVIRGLLLVFALTLQSIRSNGLLELIKGETT